MSAFTEKAVPFIKSYGLLIGLGLLAIVGLPTAFYFSHQMNEKFAEEIQAQVSKDHDAVSKVDLTYSLPGPDGEQVLEHKAPYNAETIAWYADRWKDMKDRAGAVWEQGLKINRADHAPLIQGVFPAPPDLERDVKVRELIGAVIEFHRKLLANARAGQPPDPSVLADQIRDHRNAYLERLKAQRGTADLSAAERDKLTEELVDVRVDRCRRRALELGVYADIGVFAALPPEVPTKAPSLSEAWDLQERSWIHADIIRAIAAANQSSQTGILDAVVKRIFRIDVQSPGYDPANPAPQAFDPGEERAPLDPTRSLTGRISGPGSKNKWYDLRQVDLDVITSSKRIPELIDALARTNFMTVLAVDLSAVSSREDLRAGFYYGDDHVVRARLSIEFVLLREWRKELMPVPIKQALGMDETVTGVEGGAGGAPPRSPAGGGGIGGRSPGGGGKRPN